MSETPISPLRARMIEDMSVRKFGEKTQNDYIRHVKTFSTFLGRSPVRATAEDLRRFQVHQSKEGTQPPTINSRAEGDLEACWNGILTIFNPYTFSHSQGHEHASRMPGRDGASASVTRHDCRSATNLYATGSRELQPQAGTYCTFQGVLPTAVDQAAGG